MNAVVLEGSGLSGKLSSYLQPQTVPAQWATALSCSTQEADETSVEPGARNQFAGTDGAEACALVGLRAINGRTSEQSITTVMTLIAGAYFPMLW